MAVEDTAREILAEIGEDNVVQLTHCATRLRFTLKDATTIDKNKVDKIKGVLAAVPQTDTTFQVVIGGGVAPVCDAINEMLEDKKKGKKTSKKSDKPAAKKEKTAAEVKAEARSKRKGGAKVDAFFEYLADSFRPILGVLMCASLVIAGINLLISINVIPNDTCNPTVMFFKAIGQGVFYFIPIMIACNAGHKLKVDAWACALVVMILMTPHFLSLAAPFSEQFSSYFGDDAARQAAQNVISTYTVDALGKTFTMSNILGIPMVVYDYSGNVFMPLLMAPILAFFYRTAQKIIPQSVQLVFVPTISIILTVFITGYIIGPLGIIIGSSLGIALDWVYHVAPFIFMIAIPLVYPFLVPVGLHWPLNALMLMNIQNLGYDFIQGPMGVWNFACFGTTCGVFILSCREKDAQMRSVSAGALLAGLLGGVSEPSLYGIHLRFKRSYKSLLSGCLVGGVVMAVLSLIFPSPVSGVGVTTNAFAFTSLLTIPAFTQIPVYGISIIAAFATSAALICVLDYRNEDEKIVQRAEAAAVRLGLANITDYMDPERIAEIVNKDNKVTDKTETYELTSPCKGNVIGLDATGDPAFTLKALGEGTAVNPAADTKVVVSPIDGVVGDVASSKHAYTIEGDNGATVLVHIGVDTVKLHGENFTPKVEAGDEVKAGDVLAEVDFDGIKKAGYKNCVVATVVNTVEMAKVLTIEGKDEVSEKDAVVTIEKYV